MCLITDHKCNSKARQPAVLMLILLIVAYVSAPPACAGQNWPSFRGAAACGVADGRALVEMWDVAKGENIAWKTAIPGLAHSSPIIWGNRIFVTTAVEDAGESTLKVGLYGDIDPVEEDQAFSWRLYCIDKNNGEVLWQKEAFRGKPRVKRHPKSTHANATPATNGKHVAAFFGSEGLYCYDMDGELVWEKDLGLLDWGYYRMPNAQWGGANSPVIHEQMVILQCDVQKNSFLAAFDLSDGSELWRTPRDEVPTWSAPTVYTGEKHSQIIVNGYKHIGGYDIQTGHEIWRMSGGGDIPVPTPVVAGGLAFITNAHGVSPIYAVRLSARGDITLDKDASSNAHVAWSYRRGGNYMTTPLAYGQYLYCCSDSGRLSCFELETGRQVYRESLSESSASFSASPVAADGKIYCPGEKGDIYVVKAGPEFRVLAVNQMGETVMATPAISEGTLYVRARNHLFAIRPEQQQ